MTDELIERLIIKMREDNKCDIVTKILFYTQNILDLKKLFDNFDDKTLFKSVIYYDKTFYASKYFSEDQYKYSFDEHKLKYETLCYNMTDNNRIIICNDYDNKITMNITSPQSFYNNNITSFIRHVEYVFNNIIDISNIDLIEIDNRFAPLKKYKLN